MNLLTFESIFIHMYTLKLKLIDGKEKVFDPVRKKYVAFTPEEKVRQYLIQYLHHELKYPFSLMMVEKSIKVNDLDRRFDLACADKYGKTRLLIECKSPDVKINQEVFNQLSAYNISSKVDYLAVSNGIDTYACVMDYQERSFKFIESIPTYLELNHAADE